MYFTTFSDYFVIFLHSLLYYCRVSKDYTQQHFFIDNVYILEATCCFLTYLGRCQECNI